MILDILTVLFFVLGLLLIFYLIRKRRRDVMARQLRYQGRGLAVTQGYALAEEEAEERPMKTVLIYVNTSADIGDVDHLKVFANEEATKRWFKENDPEGVAFEYEVLE